MKNGTHFSKLTLVENDENSSDNDPVAYSPNRQENETSLSANSNNSRLFFVLLTVSISCAAASVATGSYAVWLARQQAAHQALTDVNEILRSCQSRMSQLESDLQRLPNRQG